jgi:4'-phosphopantetheinyl transferase EntD
LVIDAEQRFMVTAFTIPDLDDLFDSKVATSAGFASEESAPSLSPLRDEEIPEGFSRWAEKRQREFRAGRHHAKRAMNSLGLSPSSLPRDADGVPTFPPGYSGTITHTGRQLIFAAAAVSPLPVRIGLDAENISTWSHALVERILNAEEERDLNLKADLLPAHLRDEERVGVLAFSAKEAFYKSVFPVVRKWIDFHDVVFRLGTTPGEFVIETFRPDLPALPANLNGRYLCTEKHVICGVSWLP